MSLMAGMYRDLMHHTECTNPGRFVGLDEWKYAVVLVIILVFSWLENGHEKSPLFVPKVMTPGPSPNTLVPSLWWLC
jgi:hypothetical protein